MANFNRTWEESRVEQLKGLLVNHTYNQIAKIMNVTRNAVASAVSRLVDKKPDLRIRRVVKPEPLVTKETRQNGPLSINFAKKYATIPDDLKIKHKPVSFPSSGCLAIIGEPRNLMCCGVKRVTGQSWCKAHCDVYFTAHKKQ